MDTMIRSQTCDAALFVFKSTTHAKVPLEDWRCRNSSHAADEATSSATRQILWQLNPPIDLTLPNIAYPSVTPPTTKPTIWKYEGCEAHQQK